MLGKVLAPRWVWHPQPPPPPSGRAPLFMLTSSSVVWRTNHASTPVRLSALGARGVVVLLRRQCCLKAEHNHSGSTAPAHANTRPQPTATGKAPGRRAPGECKACQAGVDGRDDADGQRGEEADAGAGDLQAHGQPAVELLDGPPRAGGVDDVGRGDGGRVGWGWDLDARLPVGSADPEAIAKVDEAASA